MHDRSISVCLCGLWHIYTKHAFTVGGVSKDTYGYQPTTFQLRTLFSVVYDFVKYNHLAWNPSQQMVQLRIAASLHFEMDNRNFEGAICRPWENWPWRVKFWFLKPQEISKMDPISFCIDHVPSLDASALQLVCDIPRSSQMWPGDQTGLFLKLIHSSIESTKMDGKTMLSWAFPMAELRKRKQSYQHQSNVHSKVLFWLNQGTPSPKLQCYSSLQYIPQPFRWSHFAFYKITPDRSCKQKTV